MKQQNKDIEKFLRIYFSCRPLFLSLIRAAEASFYQQYLPLRGKVLDVGCGDGFFASVAFGKSARLTAGLDLADSRINEASGKGIYGKLVTYDGIHFPFAAGSFDTVVSNCVLEHVSDLDAVLAEIRRVLAAKGTFITTVMAYPWEENLFGSILAGSAYRRWMRRKQVHVNLLTRKKWDARFQRAGFTVKDRYGYLTPRDCRLIDFCHYLSIPSLVTYRLWKKWVLFPQVAALYPVGYFARVLGDEVSLDEAGAVMYRLGKGGRK